MLAQPHALAPPWLKEDVVTRAPGGFPAQPLAELQAVGARFLAKEARVRGAAILPAEVLCEDRGSVPHEPRESRMRAGKASPDFLLQREEQHAQDALAELNAVLNDAVAFVLMGRGRLFKDAATLEGGKAIPKGQDGILVIAFEGHWLASCDAEIPQTFLRQEARGDGAIAFAGYPPGADSPRLPVFGEEDG